MIELGQHAEYIAGAWIGVALVTLGLIAMTLAGLNRQKRRIAQLEASGARRRSSATEQTKP